MNQQSIAKSQTGIAHLALVALIITVAVVGFAGYRVLSGAGASPEPQPVTTQTSNSSDTDDSELDAADEQNAASETQKDLEAENVE